MAWIGPVRRWDLFWADLEPGVGREQKGPSRPVLVVSNDGFNAAFRMATILPATKVEGKQRKVYPFEVQLPKGMITKRHASIIMPHQIRSISSLRLLDRIGSLEDPVLREAVENRLLEHLGIAFEAES